MFCLKVFMQHIISGISHTYKDNGDLTEKLKLEDIGSVCQSIYIMRPRVPSYFNEKFNDDFFWAPGPLSFLRNFIL